MSADGGGIVPCVPWIDRGSALLVGTGARVAERRVTLGRERGRAKSLTRGLQATTKGSAQLRTRLHYLNPALTSSPPRLKSISSLSLASFKLLSHSSSPPAELASASKNGLSEFLCLS